MLWLVAFACHRPVPEEPAMPLAPPPVSSADTGEGAALPVAVLISPDGLLTVGPAGPQLVAPRNGASTLRAAGGELWAIGETRRQRYTPGDWEMPAADWFSEPLEPVDLDRCGDALWIGGGSEVVAHEPGAGARLAHLDLTALGDGRASAVASVACAGDRVVVAAIDPADLTAPGRLVVLALDGAVVGEFPVGPAPRVDPDPTDPSRPWLRIADGRNELLRFDITTGRIEPPVATLPVGVSVLTLATAPDGTAVLATRSSAAVLDVRAGAWCVSPDGTVRTAPSFDAASSPAGISVDGDGIAWVLVSEAPDFARGKGWLWPIEAATCAPELPEPIDIGSGDVDLLGVAAW